MKRLIISIFILLTYLWAIPSWGQANRQQFCRVRDRTNPNSLANVFQLTLNMDTGSWGLVTKTGNYFYDATDANWRWWNGMQAATNLTALPRAPFTLDLPYFYSISSTDLELWRGDPLNNDTLVTTTEAPYVGSMGHIHLTDGDVWARDKGEVADGGNIAATVSAAYRFSLNYGWNGTNWSPGLIGASGEWQMTDVAVRPGEDSGNDWRKIKKEETAVYNPMVTTGTAVDDAGTDIVCASTYVLNLPNWSVFVKNAGGGSADAFTDVDVQISYNGTDWSSETSTACDTLAAGNSARCYKGVTESAAYVRVVAACGAGDDTTADCVIQGNKN